MVRASGLDTGGPRAGLGFSRFQRWAVEESGFQISAVRDATPQRASPHRAVVWSLHGTHSAIGASEIEDPNVLEIPTAGNGVPHLVWLCIYGPYLYDVVSGQPTHTTTPGRIHVIDNSEPWHTHTTHRTRRASIQVLRQDLHLSDRQLEQVLADRLIWAPWQTQLVLHHCQTIQQSTRSADYSYDPIGLDRYLAALAELVIRSAAGIHTDEPRTAAERHQRALRYIDAHLADPTLTPDSIAADQHISTRQLARCFPAGQTITDTIRRIRLEQAHLRLADPRYTTLGIAQIAHQCGFLAAAHFSRTYKDHYGHTPCHDRNHTGPSTDRPTADLAR